jgi:hypothetical protein
MTNHVSKKPMTENNSFFTREFRAEQTHSIESTHHEAELTHSQAEPMQQIKSNGVWPDQTRTAVAACGPIRLEQRRRRRDKKTTSSFTHEMSDGGSKSSMKTPGEMM